MRTMTIRKETQADIAGIHAVEQAAFGRPTEARLVDALRTNGKLVISLAAEEGGKVVGHIAFSAIITEPAVAAWRILGLAPLAVAPDKQKQGIGSALVKNGLEEALRLGYTHVVLLGGPYYHRFGFVAAQQYGISSVYNAGDHFMIVALTGAAMPVNVMMKYVPEFG